MDSFPETLQNVILYFSDPNRALDFAVRMRWPEGVSCPRCGCDNVYFIASRHTWECKGCKKQFSVKVGTIMEDSPIGLDKWLSAMWLLGSCKNGISSYEIARDLGVTQKTAWFLLHRIRLVMRCGSLEKKLCGTWRQMKLLLEVRQRTCTPTAALERSQVAARLERQSLWDCLSIMAKPA